MIHGDERWSLMARTVSVETSGKYGIVAVAVRQKGIIRIGDSGYRGQFLKSSAMRRNKIMG
jgi:hypothetical protein